MNKDDIFILGFYIGQLSAWLTVLIIILVGIL